jgi:hypothetical protein
LKTNRPVYQLFAVGEGIRSVSERMPLCDIGNVYTQQIIC